MTAQVAEVPTHIRPPTPEERDSFVRETELKVRQPYGVQWSDWLARADAELRRRLEVDYVRVLESDETLIGFVHATREGVLRMLYVKRDLRGFGFGSQMLVEQPRDPVVVHKPNGVWRKWAYAKNIRWRDEECV